MTKLEIKTIREMKSLLNDRKTTFDGIFFWNNDQAYKCQADDHKEIRDYYFSGLEGRTGKLHNKDYIKKLVWDKSLLAESRGDKILYKGVVYDVGEAGIEEFNRFKDHRDEQYQIRWGEHCRRTHNTIAKQKIQEAVNNYTVQITEEAKEKAHTICERVAEITGPNEIHLKGLNFTNKQNSPAIRDIYITDSQDISGTRCTPDGRGDRTMNENIASDNKYVMAWLHSHVYMPTYHSPTDDATLKGSSYMGESFEFDIEYGGYKSKAKAKILPSLVFNAKRDTPNIEIGADFTLPCRLDEGRKGYMNIKNLEFEIINEQNGIILDIPTIDKEIYEKARWRGKNHNSLEERLESEDPATINSHTGIFRHYESYISEKLIPIIDNLRNFAGKN